MTCPLASPLFLLPSLTVDGLLRALLGRFARGFKGTGECFFGLISGVRRTLLGALLRRTTGAAAVDQEVLDQGNGIGRYPIDEQPGGEPRDERGERDRQTLH